MQTAAGQVSPRRGVFTLGHSIMVEKANKNNNNIELSDSSSYNAELGTRKLSRLTLGF